MKTAMETLAIKEKLEEILSLYQKDEERCGGYERTRYSHIDAPEDYVESRIDWNTIRNRAEDMYDGILFSEFSVGSSFPEITFENSPKKIEIKLVE